MVNSGLRPRWSVAMALTQSVYRRDWLWDDTDNSDDGRLGWADVGPIGADSVARPDADSPQPQIGDDGGGGDREHDDNAQGAHQGRDGGPDQHGMPGDDHAGAGRDGDGHEARDGAGHEQQDADNRDNDDDADQGEDHGTDARGAGDGAGHDQQGMPGDDRAGHDGDGHEARDGAGHEQHEIGRASCRERVEMEDGA